MEIETEKIEEKVKEYSGEIRERYTDLTLVFFLLATGLMLYQHSTGWSWDFNTYSMIGEYIFHSGFYMEWLRPPLASTAIGLLQYIFTRKISEYVFIGLTSAFFLYSSRKFSESFDLEPEKFYIFALTPAVIFFSTMNGTEMLSLAFALLFLADFQKTRSGLWLGLTFLTRYNFGVLIPLILLQRNLKKIVKTGIISGLTLVPWLLYNYIQTGNPLTSFGNFLMLNVFLRYTSTALNPHNLLIMTLPTAAILLAYLKPEIREKINFSREDVLIISYSGLVTLSYLTADYRSLRYLYPLTVPAAFYASKAWTIVDREKIFYMLAAVNLVVGGLGLGISGLTPPGKYLDSADAVNGCMAESEYWLMTNYADAPTRPVSNENTTMERLQDGYRSISFKGPDYRNLSAPVLEDNGRFTVYGYSELCKKPGKADRTYLEGFNERNNLNYTFLGYIYDRFIKEKLEALGQWK